MNNISASDDQNSFFTKFIQSFARS
jgi:hypothetical protein